MKEIEKKVCSELGLSVKINSVDFDCYKLETKKYISFFDKIIKRDNIQSLLSGFEALYENDDFSQWKTIIVVAFTDEEFSSEELMYFDNIGTIVVLYLIDKVRSKEYSNECWTFFMGLNYKKYIKKIKLALKNLI